MEAKDKPTKQLSLMLPINGKSLRPEIRSQRADVSRSNLMSDLNAVGLRRPAKK